MVIDQGSILSYYIEVEHRNTNIYIEIYFILTYKSKKKKKKEFKYCITSP